MADEPARALIAEHVRRLMNSMGFSDVQLTCEMLSDESMRFSVIAGAQGRLLIGVQGANLDALQHVVRCVLRKHVSEHTRIVVDINGYRSRREQNLFGFAEEVARRAQKTGRPVALNPMSAVDRRTIHAALSSHKEVVTQSTGDGKDRRVVVRPVFL